MRRLVGAALVDADVLCLVVGQHGQLGAELVQVESGDLLVEVLGEHVDLLGVAPRGLLVPELELRDHLVGERARHHERRVARRAPQVEQAALGEHDDAVAVGEDEAVALRLDRLALDARPGHEAGWRGVEEFEEGKKKGGVSFFSFLLSSHLVALFSLPQKKKLQMERELTHVDLVVEVADVADDGVVLHLGHVVGHDDVLF